MSCMNNTHLHPVFAEIIASAAAMPAQVERAAYVSRLLKMDWAYAQSDDGAVYRAGVSELAALKELRARLDPGHEIWNRHAPEWAHEQQAVHTFRDFTGNAPVVVEWVSTELGPRVIAVVVETAGGPHAITADLSSAALDRYQRQAEAIGAARPVLPVAISEALLQEAL